MQLQYIGARYVPIWYENTDDGTANWQINVEYEPLTWVTTTNNHLYLSKKTVPDNIGDPANNTNYWLDMGVFITGQYELLQEQIDALRDSLAPEFDPANNYSENDLVFYDGVLYIFNTSHTAGNPWNASEVSAVTDLFTSIILRLEALEKRVPPMKVAMFGDSFCDTNGSLTHGVASAVKEALGLSNDDFIVKHRGGIGLVATVSGENYQTYTDDLISEYPDVNFTDIVIETAGNDANNTVSDINAAKSYITTTLSNQWPDVRIWWVFSCGSYSPTSRTKIHNTVAYILLYGNTRKQNRFFNASAPLYLTKYHADSVHPNERGATLIGMMIARNMLGSGDNFYEIVPNQNQLSLTPASGITWGNPAISWKVENNNLTIKIGGSNLQGTFAFNYNGQVFFDLGTFDNFIIPNYQGVPNGAVTESVLVITVPVTAWNNNETVIGSAHLIIANVSDVPHLYLGGIRFPTITADHIYIQGATISLPCNY